MPSPNIIFNCEIYFTHMPSCVFLFVDRTNISVSPRKKEILIFNWERNQNTKDMDNSRKPIDITLIYFMFKL